MYKTDSELRATKPPQTYDNTLRSTFRDCPRKFYFFLRGLDYDRETKPFYFVFGSAWAEGLKAFYESKSEVEAIKAALSYWEAQTLGAKPIGSSYDTAENLTLLLDKYFSIYGEENWNLIEAEIGWEWPLPPQPENYFTPIHSSYYLGGALDGYIEWPGYGTLALEHKTTGGYLTDGYIRQWSFSQQVTGYIWYLNQLLGECFGCLMNLACKRIHGGKTPQFARALERRTESQLREFISGMWADIEQIERCWTRWTWPITVNPVNCTGGMGRSKCLFLPICLSGDDYQTVNPLSFPGIGTREEEWKPWERKGEQS